MLNFLKPHPDVVVFVCPTEGCTKGNCPRCRPDYPRPLDWFDATRTDVAKYLRVWVNASYRRDTESASQPWIGESEAERILAGGRLLFARSRFDRERLTAAPRPGSTDPSGRLDDGEGM